MSRTVKRAFKYRCYPTSEQAELLHHTFGCVRYVWNKALAERIRRYKDDSQSTTYVDTAKWLTAWKREDDSAFLTEGAVPSSVTVSQDSAGRWFVSMLVEETLTPKPSTGEAVGVDAGLDHLLTLSTGEKVTNPRHERRDRRKLAKAQKNLARKQKGSVNRAKARGKVARIHARIADRRRDNLHKVTTRLVRENQAMAIEDLTVRNMLNNHSLARAISDAAWSELRGMLEYKTQWYGRELLLVDRWFPSSKLCSTTGCGHKNTKMPLNVRSWTCPACGTVHDRDVNAAKNVLAAGLAER